MNVRHILHKSLLLIAGVMGLASCDWMTDDLSDCPAGLYVNFVYDYNIQRADMFKDHVGSVTLYVYDESERLVAQRTVNGSQLSIYGFNIHFTEDELAPGHEYRLQALALQRDWNAQLNTPGAKYRRNEPGLGDSRQQLSVTLDHLPLLGGNYFSVPATAPLDTLWHTLVTLNTSREDVPAATQYKVRSNGEATHNGVETVKVVKGEPTYATVSLIRDTNHLNLTLNELTRDDTFANVSPEDFEVFILDRNATVDYQNNVVASTDTLLYTPYASWTTNFEVDGEVVDGTSAHYDLMFNRLVYSKKSNENAVLCIRRRSTGSNVALINLPELLSKARTYYENSYEPQEYLDREYDYRLELFLKGDRWQYVNLHIHILPWPVRIQNVDLQ